MDVVIISPSFMVAASALLAENPAPNRHDVEDALGGVLCRCTGYSKIIDAVLAVGGDAKISPRPQAGQNVGSPIRHLDGQPKVDGSLIYGDDAMPQDALLVRVIRSPHHYSRTSISSALKSSESLLFSFGFLSSLIRLMIRFPLSSS